MVDEKAWRTILTGWESPKMGTNDDRVVKPKAQWIIEEEKHANANSK
ncbi:hypothetical protein CXB51_009429 [Gossypium anomalum]|uniref:Gag-pol polyprotein n=1 Tax=Gossypium anomalum TaxID=47600 RepID=A0A8J5Z8V2_9ROSI|nr:hypothetical protein CXB51_009429 [Gossypium anomalum]